MPLHGHLRSWLFQGNDAANLGETLSPVLQSLEVGAVADNKIVMTYSELLDTGSVPAVGDGSLSGTAAVIASVAVSGMTVTWTLDSNIYDNETVMFSYTAGANPIRDLAHNNAANLVSQSVTNNSATVAPVQLSIAFVATQFNFYWKAPSGSTLVFHWGDGTTSSVAGQDAAEVTTTSSYAGAGTYSFYITGDVLDLTYINIASQTFVSGNVSGWSALTHLTYINCRITSVSGDVSGWSALTNLEYLYFRYSSVSGDVSSWSALTNLINLSCRFTSISGDISSWSALTNLTFLSCYNTLVDFDGTTAWSMTGTIDLYSNGWTSAQVDNALAAFAGTPVTGCTINVAGTNAARTAASDANKAIIIDVGNSNTLNVNE